MRILAALFLLSLAGYAQQQERPVRITVELPQEISWTSPDPAANAVLIRMRTELIQTHLEEIFVELVARKDKRVDQILTRHGVTVKDAKGVVVFPRGKK